MRVLKGFAGVGVQIGMTLAAVIVAMLLAYVTDESESVWGGVLCFMVSLVVVGCTYFIWYQVKRVQTKGGDLSHYNDWILWMLASTAIGLIGGGLAGFLSFGIMYYTPWIFIVTVVEGLVLQFAGSLIAYLMIRPL